jgi:tRNA threonylcarbamoyladenosine biosynthesis protein TsaE
MVWRTTVAALAGTEALGRRLGRVLFPGAVVALVGPLGAGKTHLARAIAAGLGIDNPAAVNSPTFVLIQEYAGPVPVYHFDVYRLHNSEEFAELGAHEYLQSRGVCIIEWADRVRDELPVEHLLITITTHGPDERDFEFAPAGPRHVAAVRALFDESQPLGDDGHG